MDIPSEVWNPIPVSILSQKTSHSHWRNVTKQIWLLGCERPAHHCPNRLGIKPYLQTHRNIINVSSYRAKNISPDQYSRPQRSAVSQWMNRRLVFGYQQYLQQPFYLECSDLKSCYDIIVHSASSLALQRLGIPLSSIISMLDTIQRMAHRVSTSYGDSNLTHGRDTITK